MNVRRGDVVLVWYPFASGNGGSRRPAVVIRNDADNARMRNTVVARVTTNLARADQPTHLLIESASPEGRRAGLLHDSVISCNNPATFHESLIQATLGTLSGPAMAQIDACLKAASPFRDADRHVVRKATSS